VRYLTGWYIQADVGPSVLRLRLPTPHNYSGIHHRSGGFHHYCRPGPFTTACAKPTTRPPTIRPGATYPHHRPPPTLPRLAFPTYRVAPRTRVPTLNDDAFLLGVVSTLWTDAIGSFRQRNATCAAPFSSHALTYAYTIVVGWFCCIGRRIPGCYFLLPGSFTRTSGLPLPG